jgi:putative acetyltransferase
MAARCETLARMPVTVVATAWEQPDATALRDAQRAELEQRYGRNDSETGPAPTAADVEVFLVAYVAGLAVGCAGLRRLAEGAAEIKRMYVDPAHRGSDVARAILVALEQEAARRGIAVLRLETGDRQPDAMRFYEREGYAPIPAFGHYVDSVISRCYQKVLEG